MLRALILDFGGVLGLPQPRDWYRTMATRLGVGEAAFHKAYWCHRDAYDAGLLVEEYWGRVHASLGLPFASRQVAALVESDVQSWTQYRDEVWAIARSFRARGGRTALLSNSGPEMMARVRADRALDAWFDAVIVSAEVGLSKPDARIFELCLSRLQSKPAESLFVDDRDDNTEAAARVGLLTLHFAGDHAVDRLRALVTS
jgi:putative hydrolase of the HAD superfamily